MTAFYTDYNQFLCQRLIYSGDHTVESVRLRMNVPKSTLYNYLENRSQFPAEQAQEPVPRLHSALQALPGPGARRPPAG